MERDRGDLFNAQQYQGTLAAGGQISLRVEEYFALISGIGLQVMGKGRGRFIDLQAYTRFGDGAGPIGTIVLYNPTGGAVSYSLITASVAFDPSALSNTNNVQITGSAVTLATTSTATGPAAHDAVVSGNPILVAAEAVNAERAAVQNGDVARLITDLVGKHIVLPYANPEAFLSGKTAAMSLVADTVVIAAQGAGVRLYITSLIITCSHATVGTEVVIKDGATELLRVFVAAASGTAGPQSLVVTLPVPLRLTANTALNGANVTTGSNTYVAAVGYKGI